MTVMTQDNALPHFSDQDTNRYVCMCQVMNATSLHRFVFAILGQFMLGRRIDVGKAQSSRVTDVVSTPLTTMRQLPAT